MLAGTVPFSLHVTLMSGQRSSNSPCSALCIRKRWMSKNSTKRPARHRLRLSLNEKYCCQFIAPLLAPRQTASFFCRPFFPSPPFQRACPPLLGVLEEGQDNPSQLS